MSLPKNLHKALHSKSSKSLRYFVGSKVLEHYEVNTISVYTLHNIPSAGLCVFPYPAPLNIIFLVHYVMIFLSVPYPWPFLVVCFVWLIYYWDMIKSLNWSKTKVICADFLDLNCDFDLELRTVLDFVTFEFL